MKLKTSRLVLREFTYGDEIDLFEMCSDQETAFDAGWKPHKNVDVSKGVVSNYMFTKETLAITLAGSGKVIGTISLYSEHFRKGVNCRELGFCLNKKYRGYGYMSEAVERILEYGFNDLNVDIIFVCHHDKNYSCKKLINSFDFKYEGTLRKYRKLYDGTVVDALMYSMTKEEFEEKKL